MRIQILMLVLALLGGAGDAAAQRGSDRDRGDDRTGPVELLLRRRDRLDLTDAQVERLTEIRRSMEEANRPLVARLLEIRRESRAALERLDGDRERRRSELRRRAEAARPLLDRIRDNNRAAMRRVGEVLTREQKEALRRMLRDRDEEDDDGRRRRGRGR